MAKDSTKPSSSENLVSETSALNPNQYTPFKISEIQRVTHNTSIIRFKIGDNQVSGMVVPSSVKTMLPPTKEEEPITRKYTIITEEHTKGYMDLIVKEYPEGIMSKYINSLKVGDELLMKGPIQKSKYVPGSKKEIGMIAGGTGIAPMMQVIHKVIGNPEDTTKIKLLFANVTENDILLKDELDRIREEHPEQLEIHYVLDNPPKGWTGETGYISEEMIKKYMPSPEMGDDCIVYVSGPRGMNELVKGKKIVEKGELVLGGILKKLGYTQTNVRKF
ncbi:hypothetical protein BB558_000384 [Smittium angustum]|uniref:NADH-cytochrome b5 reductase n=1 Tax=Smittium angustum TaxID=133377 RepID=A0A2U1JEB9_SMIAN|nr:hypothetical protein BB558_000384 [Smittium angustum]